MLAAQFGMAGSAVIGRAVQAGGQSGMAGHLEIGDGALLAGRAAIVGNVAAGSTMAGYPAVEIGLWRRSAVALKRLPELLKRMRAVEKCLADITDDDRD